MSDTEKPGFNVVDRRRSAQQATPSTPAAEAVPADTSTPNTNADSAAPTTAPNIPETRSAADALPLATSAEDAQDTPDTFDDDAPDEQASGGMPMPDPSALLSYVAMQMDVKSLSAALLGVFAAQAWRALGLVANPVTGQTDKNLPEAQIAIDCVQFLLGKVESDLPEPDRREMQRRLNDLRMNYITKLREG